VEFSSGYHYLCILVIGLMARNIAAGCLMGSGYRRFLAGSVYKTLKQLLETLLKDTNGKFRRVILVEYPRHGIWAIAFVTGTISNEIQSHLARPMLSVLFLPPQIPLPVGMQLFRKTRCEHFNVD